MPFAAASSEHPVAAQAVGEVVGQVLEAIGDRPDAVILFVTAPFAGAIDDIAGAVRNLLRPRALVGATAPALVAGAREVEEGAAIAVLAWRDPDRSRARRQPPMAVRFGARRTPDGWELEGTGAVDRAEGVLVLLADPASFPVDAFVDALAPADLTVVGGLAAGGSAPPRLVADHEVADHGAVGLLLPPGLAATAVVSQGCRPVGEPLVITRASGNLIEEIAGQPALDRLLAQAEAATPEDRSLMASGLQVGLVIDERQATFGRGDFLIRPVLGADRERRAVAVGAEVEVGSTIQFQVRDAASADEDLRDLLAGTEAEAALVFTCLGRGTHLFPEPHHDAEVVHDHVDSGAVAGMFCDGEIGPVGASSFVHAFTASVLLLSETS